MSRYSNYSDHELLLALHDDNDEAFAELYNRHRRKVFTMAYARVRSREVANEMVQELFVGLWERRNSLSIGNLPAYLFTAVKHRVLNYIESRLVRRKYWDYYKKFIPTDETVTENNVQFDELIDVISDRIKFLPEKSRKVFRLNHFEGKSVSEIANILDLSEKAIQYHLTRSLKELRFRLKNYW